MWFLHHFLRSIWANILGVFFNIPYLANKSYAAKKEQFDNIRTLDDLQKWFQETYRYKWDGPKGILDHNNFMHEFICSNGDCDDMAFYACKKLKQLFGKNLYYCKVRGYANLGKKFWHYDCVFQFYYSGDIYLFNYGKCRTGKSFRELDDIMRGLYSRYEMDKITSWECLWR